MVKPEELRIGNWILDHEGVPRKVAYVGDTIGVYNSYGGTQKYQHNPIYSGDIKELKPAPLTPEILQACGFTPNDKYYSDVTCYEKGRYFVADSWFHVYTGPEMANVLNKEVKYLHQLQNIYHALTGEELPVNLPA